MAELNLVQRMKRVGIPAWIYPYGGDDRHFDLRGHSGSRISGVYKGRTVDDVIDLFQGVLCRVIRPDHPRLVEIRKKYADGRVAEHISGAMANEEVVRFMETIAAELAPIGKYRVIPVTSGSTANDLIVRLALGYTQGKAQPFLLTDAYHGNNFLQNAVCGADGWVGKYAPQVFSGTKERRHFPATHEGLGALLVYCYREKIVPLVFFEDIQGAGGGFSNPGEEYLSQLVEEVHEAGGLVVNDIVQTQFRRGEIMSPLVWMKNPEKEYADGTKAQAPDFLSAAKAVANGDTLGWVAVRGDIAKEVNILWYGMHWDTFANNARYAEGARAVIEVYREEALGMNIIGRGSQYLDGMRDVQVAYPHVVQGLQGHCGLLGIVLPNGKYAVEAVAEAPEFGLSIGKGGRGGRVLRTALLADMTKTDIREAVERFGKLAGYLYDKRAQLDT